MPRHNQELNRWTIPSDWNEETDGYLCVFTCIPNSRQWRGIWNGHIDTLSYGRKWNRLSGTITDVQGVAREIFENMCAVKCSDLLLQLQCICEEIEIIAKKTNDTGQEIEGELSDGVISTGPGEQFPTQEAYFNAKCSVSNGIFDTIRNMITWLKDNNDDLLAGVFGGVTSGLIVGSALSGPISWVWEKVSAVIVTLAGYMSRFTISLSDLEAALNDTHDECVLALYNAADSLIAETDFITAVDAGTPSITSLERGLLGIMLSAEMLNQLFAPRPDMGEYVSPSPVDCGVLLKLWTFPTDDEGWTFSDDSTANASASVSYVAAEEALDTHLIVVAGGMHRTATGTNISPTVSIAVTPSNSVQIDFGAPSDGIIVGKHIVVEFTDTTTETAFVGGNTAGTLVHNITVSKTIDHVEVFFDRSNGSSNNGYDLTILLQEVRIQ